MITQSDQCPYKKRKFERTDTRGAHRQRERPHEDTVEGHQMQGKEKDRIRSQIKPNTFILDF